MRYSDWDTTTVLPLHPWSSTSLHSNLQNCFTLLSLYNIVSLFHCFTILFHVFAFIQCRLWIVQIKQKWLHSLYLSLDNPSNQSINILPLKFQPNPSLNERHYKHTHAAVRDLHTYQKQGITMAYTDEDQVGSCFGFIWLIILWQYMLYKSVIWQLNRSHTGTLDETLRPARNLS